MSSFEELIKTAEESIDSDLEEEGSKLFAFAICWAVSNENNIQYSHVTTDAFAGRKMIELLANIMAGVEESIINDRKR